MSNDTDTTPRDPQAALEGLRMSLTRVAQAFGLDEHVPGAPFDGFAGLLEACKRPRGWNALAARLVGHADEQRRAVERAIIILRGATARDPDQEEG